MSRTQYSHHLMGWIPRWCLQLRMLTALQTRTPELELIKRAQGGDGEAFARLYETHKSRVYGICLRITRERAEAEDCA